jgi:hypothetical protein
MRKAGGSDRWWEPREAFAAVVWSCILLVGAVPFPAYAGGGGESVDGKSFSFTTSATLFAVNGPRILILFGIPLFLSLACYGTWRDTDGHGLRWPGIVALACVGVVVVEAVVSLTSIGLFLIPVVGLLSVGWGRRHGSAA